MAGRSRPSFTKRLKERARQEKQREKAERKQQRKMEKSTPATDDLDSSMAASPSQDSTASDGAGESSY